MNSNSYLIQLKVLYIEDDADTREDLKRYLNKKVGKVITASDGEEGLRKFIEESPDIVIADILLPKLNGIDMLRKIREAGGKCPVIITSSVDETATILNAVDVGIVKYVVKPIILDDLMEALHKAAEEIQKNDAIFNDIEQKKELESQIKQSMTVYLKKTVGKGPRDLTAFIGDSYIEINAFGMLTPLEKKVLENRHNVSLIEHLHKSYYEVARPELQIMVGEILGIEVKMRNAEFNVMKGIDHLEFSLKEK